MHKARYLVEAHLQEGLPVGELAAMHEVHRSWIYKLIARYREGGPKALEPRSRRPRSCPHKTDELVEDAVVKLRKQLEEDGHDAGPHTIVFHLAKQFDHTPSVATIWRILKRRGLIKPQPKKRPRSCDRRFEAELPNEMWQADVTEWHLACGTKVEILNFIDDHSRLHVASDAYLVVKAQDVVETFYRAINLHGLPRSLLTDNGAVFTGRARGGKVELEYELERLGVVFKNSRPYHPQTCGKVERLHQTEKKFLAKQKPAETLEELQMQLDSFVHYYNNIRPHRALGRRTPLQTYNLPVKARPDGPRVTTYYRVRKDRVDKGGKVTLRYLSRLYHIGIGRAYKGQPIKLLIADRHIRIITAEGELIRELVLDPSRNYQPQSMGRVSTMSRDICLRCPET